ncbi:hypothetical protein FGO68_gene16214 [Halteria grandinella]|uniref:Uncharacterized protein n=1 Tax=Halteria grandinella TaxID=5974 RepID=A0A8J8NFG7_HALGN|nr:hypothetical protein FGO68_gene16214 [Halteria grandinella]
MWEWIYIRILFNQNLLISLLYFFFLLQAIIKIEYYRSTPLRDFLKWCGMNLRSGSCHTRLQRFLLDQMHITLFVEVNRRSIYIDSQRRERVGFFNKYFISPSWFCFLKFGL